MKRKERLRKREDFRNLIKVGQRYYSKQYSLVVAENRMGYVRAAVSVKKNVGKATKRNYEKRLCREVLQRETAGIHKGYDILIIVRKPTQEFHQSYNNLKNLIINTIN